MAYLYKPGDEVVPSSESRLNYSYQPKRDRIFYVGPMTDGTIAVEYHGTLLSVNPEEVMPKPKTKVLWFNVYGRGLDTGFPEYFLGNAFKSEKNAKKYVDAFFSGGMYLNTISMVLPDKS
jgi:hypothetical protein